MVHRANRTSRWALAVALGLIALAPGDVGATPLRVRVTGPAGGCPSPAAVARELGGLQPGVKVEVVAGGDADVFLWERGARYGVRVRSTRRELRDEARRCADRARALAVVVALALFPPEVALPSRGKSLVPITKRRAEPLATRPPARSYTKPPPRPPTNAVAPAKSALARPIGPRIKGTPIPKVAVRERPSPPPARPAVRSAGGARDGPGLARAALPAVAGLWHLGLELGGTFDAAPGAQGRSESLSGGFAARLLAGWRYVKLFVGVGIQSPTTADAAPALARILRIPLDFGVRGLRWLGRVRLAGDLGLAATIARVEGQGLAVANQDTRLEVGLRAALSVAVRMGSRLAPFVAIQMTYVPRPFTLAVEPVGAVGSTPRLRLGGIIGIAVRLR